MMALNWGTIIFFERNNTLKYNVCRQTVKYFKSLSWKNTNTYNGVHKCSRVYPGVCGYAWVFGGWVQVWERGAWVRAGVRRFALGYACVCGINFQNFFRRIESLHQQTLIRFLYEFLYQMCHIDLFWFRISNFRCMQNWIKIL